jgi:hypothetical protein
MQEVQDSDLPDDTKALVLARAKSMAIEHGYNTVMTVTDGKKAIAGTKAVWTTKFMNDLDDSAFLYVEPGGTKDSDGKTIPRSKRHFPYKDDAGKVDLPHLRNALARIPQSTLPDDVKQRVAKKAQKIAQENGIETAEAAKAVLATLKDADSDTEYAGSYEDLIEDLRALLNPPTPWNNSGWTCILATYPDHLICQRYGDDEPTYWHVLYDLDDSGVPVLGTATQVTQTYVPVEETKSAPGPLNLDAHALRRAAVAFGQRTEDLFTRRLKEGRTFSTANLKELTACRDALNSIVDRLGSLLEASDRTAQDQAKAAFLLSPEGRAREIELLELATALG